jgi:hypothetical protein
MIRDVGELQTCFEKMPLSPQLLALPWILVAALIRPRELRQRLTEVAHAQVELVPFLVAVGNLTAHVLGDTAHLSLLADLEAMAFL